MKEAGFLSTRIGFSLREVHVGFVVNKVELGNFYLRVFNFLLSAPFRNSSLIIHSSVNNDILILAFA
jgi:hypothetical protein